MKLSRHIRGWLLYWKMRFRYAFSRMKPIAIKRIDHCLSREQRDIVEYIQKETLRQFFGSDVGKSFLDAMDYFIASVKADRKKRQLFLSKPWWPGNRHDHKHHKSKIN
jgi:hypothetical protein